MKHDGILHRVASAYLCSTGPHWVRSVDQYSERLRQKPILVKAVQLPKRLLRITLQSLVPSVGPRLTTCSTLALRHKEPYYTTITSQTHSDPRPNPSAIITNHITCVRPLCSRRCRALLPVVPVLLLWLFAPWCEVTVALKAVVCRCVCLCLEVGDNFLE